jgi:hypothetical protein
MRPILMGHQKGEVRVAVDEIRRVAERVRGQMK